MKLLATAACAVLFASGMAAAQQALPLWPNAAPFPNKTAGPEHDSQTPADRLIAGKTVAKITDVSVPTYTVYAPASNATGAAILVFPGGAYKVLAMDLEGTEVCSMLTAHGVTCVLVKYRVPNSGPYPLESTALADAQRAVALIRSQASQLHLDPHKIGVLGFSAGGHLAAVVSNHPQHIYPAQDTADAQSSRPDFTVLIYPAYLAPADPAKNPNAPKLPPLAGLTISANTPPAFLVQSQDDGVNVSNVLNYAAALRKANVPLELHVYAEGGHGYGLRATEQPVTHWPELLVTWLRTTHITP